MKLNIDFQKLPGITQGKLLPNNAFGALDVVKIDSRAVLKGDCFLALKGQNRDGHDFIASAAKLGASLIIAQTGKGARAAHKTARLEVKDTLKALQAIAKYNRQNSLAKIAAVTGSNGKSTVKQMLFSIASQAGRTCASEGNLNNHIGLPLSVMELAAGDAYGVFELGASKKGDIAEIANVALPDVAVITNISAAHLEFFKDLQTVYRTKAEIISALPASGVLVYNFDDPFLKRAPRDYKVNALSFGFSEGSDLVICDGDNFAFKYKNARFDFNLKLERHNKYNAAAACAAACAMGLNAKHIEKGLMSYVPMPLRMEEVKKGDTLFLLDYYNANPASMENALNVLKSKPAPHTAVLGDMRELGELSGHYHRELAKRIIALGVKTVFLAGEEMAAAYELLKNSPDIMVKYSRAKRDLTDDLKNRAGKGGTVLIKASRALNFESVFKEM